MVNKKINIAIFLDSELSYGGSYQYQYKILSIIKNKHKNNSNIIFKFYSNKESASLNFKDLGIQIKIIKENIFQKIHRVALSNLNYFKFQTKIKNQYTKIERVLNSDNIDLIYFMFPSALSLSIINIPYIFTLYDLAHLRNLEFPEVSSNRIFEIRENLYSNSLKKAQKVIVASKFEKKLAAEKYKLDESRVIVLKYLPNIKEIKNLEHLDIKKKYNLKNDYIFYPAQFWPHKNHIYILKAVKILRQNYNISIDVMFSGSDKGNLQYILESAKLLGIEDLVHYLGFVKNNEIPFLYNQSLSLVMPTYLGPSNIPPLEAFAYETPVCYPDFFFNREEFNDAVFYMNLKDPNSLAETLFKIKNDNIIRDEKIKCGKEILRTWSDKDFYQKLINQFDNFRIISECWK